MSTRVFSKGRVLTPAEELVEGDRLRLNLSLDTSYNNARVRTTPDKSNQKARVISKKEEEKKRKEMFNKLFGHFKHINNTPQIMTRAEILRSEQNMINENRGRKVESPFSFKGMIKKAIEKGNNFLNPPTRMNPLGSTPPKTNGGYNYRKYKYTNITKKPKKKILAKKPAKPKILAKKPKKKI